MSNSKINLNRSPYYNDFDPSKQYSMSLAIPGRVEQAREFTQIQSTMLHAIKGIGDSIMKDGNVREGCEISIEGNEVTVHDGKVYLNGQIRLVNKTQVTLKGVGEEVIGVKLIQKIITEVEDPTLRDPAQGYDNYNQPGAHRLKETVEVVANDPQSTPIFRFKEGVLLRDEEKPQIDIIADILARRAFDESGNYLVNGMEIVDKNKPTDNEVLVMVESGKAYVKGYEVTKPMSTPVWIPKALATRSIIAEPKIYNSGTEKYSINSIPIKDIKRLTATVQITSNITRGNVVGGTDTLPHTPVVDVVEVKKSNTTYAKGVDYQVTADGIDWSLSGQEPEIGSTYRVTWKYNKVLQRNTDYKITRENGKEYIDFTDASSKPVSGSTFTIDYSFYLARKDLIVVDYNGDIKVIPGTPDIMSIASAPYITDTTVLKLGTVLLPPNSDRVIITNNAVTKMTMEKLCGLVNRIETIEYNQAISSLDEVAIEGEGATKLKGVLTDGFIDLSKADTSHDSFTASLNPFNRYMTVGFEGTSANIEINEGDREYKGHKFKNVVSAPYSEEVLIEQARATEKLLINPYNVFQRNAIMTLTPSSDMDIAGEVTIIDGSKQRLDKLIQSSEFFNGDRWLQREKQQLEAQGYTDITTVKKGNQITLTAQSATNTFKNTIIPYIRPQEIGIEVTNLVKNTDNLKLTFDGVTLELTPSSEDYRGTEGGTLKADATGVTRGTFNIPEGIRTGTREVILENDNNKCYTTFEAQGTRQDTDITIKNITIIYKPKPAPPVDPVAQTFYFSQSRFVTSFGLYFAAKDPDENVVLEIRNVVNGYPGDIVYASKLITPDEIEVSSNGTSETKVTLDNPMYCEADQHYCVVLTTNSAVPSVFVANLGDKDLATQEFVVEQPYIGILFTSSNGLAWTPHQTKDMKLKVYGANFGSETGVITFKPIEQEATMIALNANTHVPPGTACAWEYKINEEEVWNPIPNMTDVYLSTKATKLQFRVKLSASTYLSPIISTETLFLKAIMSQTQGAYLTRNVSVPEKFTTIKQIVDLHIPSGASVDVKFATDGTGTDWVKGSQKSSTPVSTDYTQYVFEHTLDSPANNFRAKIEFNTSNPTLQPKAKNFMNIFK